MFELLCASVLLGASVFRAWRVVALDQITEPLRAALLVREGRAWEFLTDMILCPWCLGWWIAGAGAAVLVLVFGGGPVEFAMLWLASSAVAGVLGSFDFGASND